jgi:hypothetical protein
LFYFFDNSAWLDESKLCSGRANMVVVLALGGMRALTLRYGQKIADALQWGFARFAEGIALPDTFLARLDDERIGAILNGLSRDEARRWRFLRRLPLPPSRGRSACPSAPAWLGPNARLTGHGATTPNWSW